LREARNEIAWLRNKRDEFQEGHAELMTLFEDLDRVIGDAAGKREAETIAESTAYVRQKEGEVLSAHERVRDLDHRLAEKNRYIDQGQAEIHAAGRYIRHKDAEFRTIEAERNARAEELERTQFLVRSQEEELARAAELVRVKEEELHDAQQRKRDLER